MILYFSPIQNVNVYFHLFIYIFFSDKEIKEVEGQYVKDGRWELGRADVARFMLKCLDTSDWDRKLVAIGYWRNIEHDEKNCYNISFKKINKM